MTRKQWLVLILLAEFALCAVLALGGYMVYDAQHLDIALLLPRIVTAESVPPTQQPTALPLSIQPSQTPAAKPLSMSSPTLTPTNTLTWPANNFLILHHFAGQANNGRIPYGLLVLHNGTFYGTTTYGGPPYNTPPKNPDNKGNIFKINMDGTGFTILHEFAGGADDGWKPWSGLAITRDTIYGSTVYGGPHDLKGGVLYALRTDGSNYRVLHAFGEPADGFGASTSPILVGDNLYGLTRWGGKGTGTIYRYNITSGEYRLLHSFAADGSDGSTPLGTVTADSNGFLYGATWLGGRNDLGTLFRIKQDGTSFETLHHFTGGTDGKFPYDTLIFDGNQTLYGTTLGTYGNDASDLGTIFKYDIVDNKYSILHKFAGGPADSGKPNGSVVLSSDGLRLYGTTHGDQVWGGNEFGIIYEINIDGSGFKQLYEFTGSLAGDTPMRTPLLIDDVLYGMTAYGGETNYGLIYGYRLQAGAATTHNKSTFTSWSGSRIWRGDEYMADLINLHPLFMFVMIKKKTGSIDAFHRRVVHSSSSRMPSRSKIDTR